MVRFADCKDYDGRIFGAMGGVAIKPKDPKRKIKIDALMTNPNVVGQRKLNGERLEVYGTRLTGPVAYGRNTGTAGGRMEKTGLIPHIFRELRQTSIQGDTVLDGEVLFIPAEYSRDDIENLEFTEDFWKCREIMGKHKYPERGVTQQEKEGYLHYFVFDILVYRGKDLTDLTYEQRLAILDSITSSITTQHIHILPVMYSTKDKQALLDYCLSLGLEGIMLKYLTGKYHEGKKPANQWVKLKKHDFAECVIMGYSPAEQFTRVTSRGIKAINADGTPMMVISRFYTNEWIGAIYVGQWSKTPPTKGQLADFRAMDPAGTYLPYKMTNAYEGMYTQVMDGELYYLVPVAKVSGIPDALRKEISENKAMFMGRIISIKYFEVTDDSYYIPGFFEFRDDKPAEECIWTWH